MAVQRIQMRRGTTAEWEAENPTLAAGEYGVDLDLDAFKLGDGSSAWLELPWTGYGDAQAHFAAKSIEDEVTTGRLNDAILTSRFSEVAEYRSANQMTLATGAPTLSPIGGIVASWRLDAATQESVTVTMRLPRSWETFEVVVYGANATADTGNVMIRVLHVERGPLSNLSSATDEPVDSSTTTIAAAGQWIRQGIALFSSGVANNGDPHTFRILRVADDAADTKAGDYSIVGIDVIPKSFVTFEPDVPEVPEDLIGRTFTAEHNAFIPAGMKVIQQSEPPVSNDDSAGTFKLWPANVFATTQDFSDSTWDQGERGDFRWANRQNYLPGQTNNKPNYLWGPGFKTSGLEVRTTFTSVAKANAATRAQVRSMLGYSAGDIESVWTAAGGLAADIITEAFAKANLDTVFTEEFTATSGYGSGNIYVVARDTVILSTNRLVDGPFPALNTTVLIDYEVADERTEAETTQFFTDLVADATAVGKKIALYTNPLTGGIMRRHGIGNGVGGNLPTLLGIVDYLHVMLSSTNPEATAEESYDAAITALGGPLTTAEYQKLIITFGVGDENTQMPISAAEFVHDLLTAPGDDHPIGVNFWRYFGKFGGKPTRDYNERISTVVFGTLTPPEV